MPKVKNDEQELIQLEDGCYCSKISVTPADWEDKGANPKRKWYIHYRFYDPSVKGLAEYRKYWDGKQCVVKSGVNRFKTLSAKRQIVKELLQQENELILIQGYNPIRKVFMKELPKPEAEDEYVISPKTPFIKALREARPRITNVKSTLQDLKSVIDGMEKASKALKFNELPIGEVRRRHIIKCLEKCAKDNKNFTVNRYNKYRAYLLSIFKELLAVEAVEANIIKDIPIKKGAIRKERLTLTMEERIKIELYLRSSRPLRRFWIFVHIFFHAASRESELMRVKVKDVDLVNKRYKVTIMKGGEYREEWKVIKNVALDYWRMVIFGCKDPECYVFAKGLKPGPEKISERQITRRWKTHIKPLGIQADIYSLKHTNSDEVAELLDIRAAQAMNSHKSETITKLYAQKETERQKKRVEQAGNTLAPRIHAA